MGPAWGVADALEAAGNSGQTTCSMVQAWFKGPMSHIILLIPACIAGVLHDGRGNYKDLTVAKSNSFKSPTLKKKIHSNRILLRSIF